MAVFYPSARVRLVLRFDEGDDTSDLTASLENDGPPAGLESLASASTEETERLLATLSEDIGQTLRDRGVIPQSEYEYRLADLRRRREDAQRGPSSEPLPAALSAAPRDSLTVIGTVLPVSCSIGRNGLRTADTATVTIAHRDAPFDPRSIRSAGIEITLGAVSADDFARGMAGEKREDGSLYSVVPRVPSASPPAEGTTRFIGFVDDWSIDRGEGDTIELECRDLSALLLDQKLPPGIGVNQGVGIDEGIRSLLNEFPAMRGTSVVWTGEGDAPTLAGATPASRQPRRRSGRSQRARAGGENMNVWEHIVETCVQTGVVPVFVDGALRIIEPRTFYSGGNARVMVYGRNLSNLTFTRKMGGTKVPTVEVRSYDPSIGRTRWARFPSSGVGVFGETDPPRASRAASVSPSGVADDKILTFTLQVVDPEAMLRAAEALWHEIGRKEIEGTFATADIAAFIRPEDASQPIAPQEQSVGDLLTMQAGDAVEILVASAATRDVSSYQLTSSEEIAGLDAEARAQYLESIGWSREVAERFSRLQDATALQTVFRVQNVDVSFDSESGIGVKTDFINFLEVRETP